MVLWRMLLAWSSVLLPPYHANKYPFSLNCGNLAVSYPHYPWHPGDACSAWICDSRRPVSSASGNVSQTCRRFGFFRERLAKVDPIEHACCSRVYFAILLAGEFVVRIYHAAHDRPWMS
jgi:hypothetical protein